MEQRRRMGSFRVSPTGDPKGMDDAAASIAGFETPEALRAAGPAAAFDGVAAPARASWGRAAAPASLEHDREGPAGQRKRARLLVVPALEAGGRLAHFDGSSRSCSPGRRGRPNRACGQEVVSQAEVLDSGTEFLAEPFTAALRLQQVRKVLELEPG